MKEESSVGPQPYSTTVGHPESPCKILDEKREAPYYSSLPHSLLCHFLFCFDSTFFNCKSRNKCTTWLPFRNNTADFCFSKSYSFLHPLLISREQNLRRARLFFFCSAHPCCLRGYLGGDLFRQGCRLCFTSTGRTFGQRWIGVVG